MDASDICEMLPTEPTLEEAGSQEALGKHIYTNYKIYISIRRNLPVIYSLKTKSLKYLIDLMLKARELFKKAYEDVLSDGWKVLKGMFKVISTALNIFIEEGKIILSTMDNPDGDIQIQKR